MKTYEIPVNGTPHTFQLSDEDAESRGLTATKQEPAPLNKARTPKGKANGRTRNSG